MILDVTVNRTVLRCERVHNPLVTPYACLRRFSRRPCNAPMVMASSRKSPRAPGRAE